MGEKYELKFLSNLDNKDILLNISETMYKHDWKYNSLDLGKYNFWKNKPVWNFGESKEIVEREIDNGNNSEKLKNIISDISAFYSQSIVFNKLIDEKIATAIAIIVEAFDLIWKEVTIAFELNELLTFSGNIDEISREVERIFTDLSIGLKSFYAVAAIEMGDLVEKPEYLKIEETMFGDYNYFSNDCYNIEKFVNASTNTK